jgi:hypothetical protein
LLLVLEVEPEVISTDSFFKHADIPLYILIGGALNSLVLVFASKPIEVLRELDASFLLR